MSGTTDPPPATSPSHRAADDARLRYACEDCAYFVDDLEECAHGYPTSPHRKRALVIVFCKEFELA